jgi:hypothetical protein
MACAAAGARQRQVRRRVAGGAAPAPAPTQPSGSSGSSSTDCWNWAAACTGPVQVEEKIAEFAAHRGVPRRKPGRFAQQARRLLVRPWSRRIRARYSRAVTLSASRCSAARKCCSATPRAPPGTRRPPHPCRRPARAAGPPRSAQRRHRAIASAAERAPATLAATAWRRRRPHRFRWSSPAPHRARRPRPRRRCPERGAPRRGDVAPHAPTSRAASSPRFQRQVRVRGPDFRSPPAHRLAQLVDPARQVQRDQVRRRSSVSTASSVRRPRESAAAATRPAPPCRPAAAVRSALHGMPRRPQRFLQRRGRLVRLQPFDRRPRLVAAGEARDHVRSWAQYSICQNPPGSRQHEAPRVLRRHTTRPPPAPPRPSDA